MIQTIIGEKIEQTQMFLANGNRIPVTQIFVPENIVVQVKNKEKDGYTAVQVGVGKKKKPTKADLGHAKKNGMSYAARKLHEIVITEGETLPEAGAAFKIEEIFKPGDIVAVTGVSKGKGFAGVVKRHNFRGGPKTHGQSDRERAPGSIGQTTTPGRVYKGKKMAGRMGQDTVTVLNLKIVDVDSVNKKIYVSGLIPGANRSAVFITKTGESKKFEPLFKIEEPKAAEEQTVKKDEAIIADGEKEKAVETAAAVTEPKEEVKKDEKIPEAKPEKEEKKGEIK